MTKTRGTPQEPLHEENVIDILRRQNDRSRQEFIQVKAATGAEKQQRFVELRALLVAHETAEEMVLRPITTQVAGPEVAEARNAEEQEANQVLARLDHLDATSPEFDALFREFQEMV